ncbi:MAG: divalent-cation tolerance protein CutA [Pyrinomonadaceae bacterium]
MIVVLTTTPNLEEAESLARKIIEARLAACVQISPPIISFYTWKGELQKDSEHQLFIKSLSEKFEELENFIEANHSYETPEIVALRTTEVSENYLNWIKECISAP